MPMEITIKPSDLKFKYKRNVEHRDLTKFRGIPDKHPFDRDDLYEVIPMFEAVMDALESCDGELLGMLEDLLNTMPRFVETREETYHYLFETARDWLK